MIIVTRRIRIELFVPIFLLLFGCGATSTSTKATVAIKPDRVRRAEKRFEKQAELVSELEIRIAMLESAVREIRADVKKRNQENRSETIRIGHSSRSRPYSESLAEESEQYDDRNRRPVLRLYGASRRVSREEPFVMPEPPPSVPKKLTVVPLLQRGTVSHIAGENNQPDKSGDHVGVAEYRAALGLVRQRNYEQALQALSGFIENHPKSIYVDSAIYWRGEVYYATRAYREALEQFEVVTTRFPTSRKMPDSLLKIGMCHKRLGDFERARALFSRLRRQYPTSNAARIASLESSS
jgi:tol-pal system protein YbgF